jgi:hypothetical protein
MLLPKKAIVIAAVSTLATISYAGSAQAITFSLTSGITRSNGATEGAFSSFYNDPNTRTIDFNDGTVPTTGFATYSFANDQAGWQPTSEASKSSVTSDKWAPANPAGTDNTSTYLEVFTGDAVTITLQQTLNAFGIDWGAISQDNTFSFYNGDKLVQQFTSADVEPVAEKYGVKNAKQGQWNGYLEFYSESSNDNFNKIVISQGSIAGGGFESDNHSFHIGTGKYIATPEPSAALGMLAIGGIVFLRKHHKNKSLV